MKIVHDLPAPFIEKMHTCDDQDILKAFSGKTLLKITNFKTEKERQEAIDSLFEKIEEPNYQLITVEA